MYISPGKTLSKHNSIGVGKLPIHMHTHTRGNIITLCMCSGKGIIRIWKNCTCDKMADLVVVSSDDDALTFERSIFRKDAFLILLPMYC